MKQVWHGIDWVQRWFAKPDATGSIPAHASNSQGYESVLNALTTAKRDNSLSSVLEMIFDAVGGSEKAREYLKSKAYNISYKPPEPKVWLARQLVLQLVEDRDKAIAKQKETLLLLVEAKKEITSLKRKA